MNEGDHRYPVAELHIGRGKQLYTVFLERVDNLLFADQRILIRIRTECGDVPALPGTPFSGQPGNQTVSISPQ